MLNRFNLASQPVTWTSVTKTARGLLTTAQHTLTVFGLSALAMIALMYARPELAHEVSAFLAPAPAAPVTVARAEPPALSALMQAPAPAVAPIAVTPVAAVEAAPIIESVPAEPTAEQKKALAHNKKQQHLVTTWLSKRYRVAGDAADMLVSTAYLTAHEIKLDPLLILAVMAIESGLNPFAESPVGAQGLMQVMSKIHHKKFQEMGGPKAALNPVANIRVGSLILKEYVNRGGSVEAGLKTYVGAAAFETDQGYGSRVLAEFQKLKQVAAGKKVPVRNPVAPKPVAPIVEPATQPQMAVL